MKRSLQTRDVIRKLYDINNDSKNSTRIILPSIEGKDTDHMLHTKFCDMA